MITETKSNEFGHQKRNLLLMIVSVYLILSSVIAVSFMLDGEDTLHPGRAHGDAFLHYSSIFIGLSIFVVPSSIGAARLLLRKKNAFGISLGSLLLWTSISWTATLFPGVIFGSYDKLFSNPLTTLRDFLMIGSNAIMYLFLIKGWKQVQR